MSLDFSLYGAKGREIASFNITHNMNKMADAAGIYKPLWRPKENGFTKAGDVIEPLKLGLAKLKADPDAFSKHNPANGWGNYDVFVRFVEEVIDACENTPEATIHADV